MADVPAAVIHATHEVENQPPPFEDVNLFASDRGLEEATTREGAGWATCWPARASWKTAAGAWPSAWRSPSRAPS